MTPPSSGDTLISFGPRHFSSNMFGRHVSHVSLRTFVSWLFLRWCPRPPRRCGPWPLPFPLVFTSRWCLRPPRRSWPWGPRLAIPSGRWRRFAPASASVDAEVPLAPAAVAASGPRSITSSHRPRRGGAVRALPPSGSLGLRDTSLCPFHPTRLREGFPGLGWL